MRKILVIGGGAAGMMAAIAAADKGASVTIIEKNEKLGKKIYITGKGRCNVTNACDISELFENVITNEKFFYSAGYSFTQDDVCKFFEKAGLELKVERGNRVFPASDRSNDVIKTLEKVLREKKVKVELYSEVKEVAAKDGRFEKIVLSNGDELFADSVIIATGGLSYPSTGSTGDGYTFAEKMGHKIVKPLPSLVPLRANEMFIKELEGLSLRNISITIENYTDFGEMLFTSRGVTGPVILSASANLCRKIAQNREAIPLYIDLKPALSEEQLDARILRDFNENINKTYKNSLSKLLPSKLIPVIVRLSGIPEGKKVNEITREERKRLVSLIKKFELTITGTEGFSQAVVTQGGVNVKEINPSTMESKKVKGVFFAGEVMDLDAYTGGFNLQIAWSTGYLAGESAAEA